MSPGVTRSGIGRSTTRAMAIGCRRRPARIRAGPPASSGRIQADSPSSSGSSRAEGKSTFWIGHRAVATARARPIAASARRMGRVARAAAAPAIPLVIVIESDANTEAPKTGVEAAGERAQTQSGISRVREPKA